MAENIVKSVFFCFCLSFFFFCSLVSSKQVQIVKEVQNHKKSTTNGLHGETSITVSNKNIQVMSPSQMENFVFRIIRLVSAISIQSKVSCLLLSKIFYKVYVPH